MQERIVDDSALQLMIIYSGALIDIVREKVKRDCICKIIGKHLCACSPAQP